MTNEEGSWIGWNIDDRKTLKTNLYHLSASMFGVGAIFGGLISSILCPRIGPKSSLTLMALVDICHWVLMAISSSLDMMLVARFLAGLSAASYSPNITIFVAEMCEACHRGVLLGLTIPIMGLGVLAVYTMGKCLDFFRDFKNQRINRKLLEMETSFFDLLSFSALTSHFNLVKLEKKSFNMT